MKKNKNKISIFLTILSLFSFSFFINPTETKAECKIDSATFTDPGTKDDDWFVDGKPPKVTIKITATDCTDKTVEVSITEDDTLSNDDDVNDKPIMDNMKVKFTESNSLFITYDAGEDECDSENNPECNYFISVYKVDGGDFTSNGKNGGNLNYECDGRCDEPWYFDNVTNTSSSGSQELGNCTVTVSGGSPQIFPNKTKAECDTMNGTWGRKPEDKTYHFLAPLPGLEEPFDPTQASSLSLYLNIMINLFIGICAVLAVIMIVMGGLEYMTSELISSKEHGRERINSAIFGLILALGAWTILYTINPDLLNTSLSSLRNVEVVVTLDDALFAETEESVSTAGTSYKLKGSRTAGISNFLNTGGCSSLNKITVDTKTNKANFCGGTNCVSIPVGFGKNGIAEVGQGKSGDGKTPKGTYTTDSDRRIASGGVAAQSRNGYNLGAAFINIGVILNGSNRGIGFHGSASGNMGTTNGCVRMTNDDLAALAPCIKTGTIVVIQ